MPSECAGRSELAKFMAYHVFGAVNRHVLATVVDGYGVSDELRENGGRTRPGLNNFLFALFVHFFSEEDVDDSLNIIIDETNKLTNTVNSIVYMTKLDNPCISSYDKSYIHNSQD